MEFDVCFQSNNILQDEFCDVNHEQNSEGIGDKEQAILNKEELNQRNFNSFKSHDGFKSNFELIKMWEGYIEDVSGNILKAKLYDKEDNSYVIYKFEKNDIKNSDKDLIKEGALFFLYLGYYRNEFGTIFKSSYINFRRFPLQEYIDSALDSMNEEKFIDIWE